MKNGYAIFFDLDDTLYNRSEPFMKAFLVFCSSASRSALSAYWACEKRGNEVFLPSQRGEISMEEMYIYRYQKGFSDIGIQITAEEALEFQNIYSRMQKEITLGEGVPELLDYCSAHFEAVGIITNGPAEKQKSKLYTLGLSRWISSDLSLISGVLKIDKPDPAIFRLAEKKAGIGSDRMIYVGDSLKNDILPTQNLGWKTVYLNRKSLPLSDGDIHPDLILEGDAVLTPDHLEKLII